MRLSREQKRYVNLYIVKTRYLSFVCEHDVEIIDRYIEFARKRKYKKRYKWQIDVFTSFLF